MRFHTLTSKLFKQSKYFAYSFSSHRSCLHSKYIMMIVLFCCCFLSPTCVCHGYQTCGFVTNSPRVQNAHIQALFTSTYSFCIATVLGCFCLPVLLGHLFYDSSLAEILNYKEGILFCETISNLRPKSSSSFSFYCSQGNYLYLTSQAACFYLS